MSRKHWNRSIAVIIFTAVFIAAAAAVLIPRLLDLDSYKAQIVSLAEKSLDRHVSYETASLSRQLIPAIVFNGITIKEKTGDASLLTVERLSFRLALLPLLHKEVRLQEIVLERPVLMLERGQTGLFSVSDLFREQPSAFNLEIKGLRIENGVVRFTDRMNAGEPLTILLERLNLQVNGLTRGGASEFKLTTAIYGQGGRAELSMDGKADIPPQNVPFSEARLDVALVGKNLDTDCYWPYYGHFLPFERIQGKLDIQVVFKGRLQAFATKGSLKVRELRLNYPRVFRSVLTPKEINLGFDLESTPRELSAKSLELRIDGLQVRGSGALIDIHGKDPHLTVHASSSPLRFEEMRRYIPYGVIPAGTAGFIEQHVKGGVFRVAEVRLEGRLSQLLHLEQGTNYNALFVRATVDEGSMSFDKVPIITSIKGGLEFSGKDFILRGMKGNFGASPFSLEGRIADYPLATPVSYPFTMSMTPARSEVAWLLRQEKPGQNSFSGPSLLLLSGSGIAADYRLSGSWDLSGAEYRFAQRLHKPAGMTNRIRFSAGLGRAEVRLTELKYELPSLDVTASATYRYDDKVPLSFAVATNRFDVGRVLPVFPGLDPYQPSGFLQATVSATGNPDMFDSFKWQGAVTLAELSFRPSAQLPLVNHLNGTIDVSGTVLKTKQLTGKLGDSEFSVKGSLSGFSNPAAEVVFASPGLHLSDIGYLSPGQDPLLKNLAAKVLLQDWNLTISTLSGQVNQTSFTVQGDPFDLRNPKIALRVNFPILRAEDMLMLTGLKPAAEGRGKPADIALKVTVVADEGTVREIPFTKLAAELSLQSSRLVVQTVSLGVLGGMVSGSGRADMLSDGGPGYQAQYRLDRVDAAQLLKLAGAEQSVTGLLTASGEVTARGDNADELKKTASGTAELELNSGRLVFAAITGEEKRPEVPLKKIQGRLSFARNVVTLQSARIEVFDGVVSGKGVADFSVKHDPGYHVSYQMGSIDAGQLDQAFGFKSDITGRLTLQGEQTARGDSPDELLKTARGAFGIRLEKGVINKFSVISKVFSVLNVSQLFDFKLPDMVSVGMPYNSVNGNFSVKDGCVTTSDLSINSQSINIIIVGTADIVKKYVDLTIAVQLLQTVGKFVSRIPVIGWLLTGGERRFLVTYFEAKGDWDNPKVSSTPIEGLSSGAFNIFKRVLNLPEKLISDPNKVIMDK